ncbi:MAG: hypothetical protein ACK55Z_08325 [bacterium]
MIQKTQVTQSSNVLINMNVLKNDDLKNVPTAQTALGKLQERSLTQDAPSLFQPSQNMGFG